jgi:hypothetical protein
VVNLREPLATSRGDRWLALPLGSIVSHPSSGEETSNTDGEHHKPDISGDHIGGTAGDTFSQIG